MSVFEGFIGPSNRTRSRNVSPEHSINCYLESQRAGTPKVQWALLKVPGLKPYAALGSGPVRGLFSQNGRVFGVGGSTFCEILPSQNTLVRGLVVNDGLPATMASNGTAGNQVIITAGGRVYIFALDTSVFTEVTTGPWTLGTVTQALFFDQYFIVLTTDGFFWLSTLDDGLTWNGLDFGGESQFSDTVVAMTKTHDNLWLFGTQNTGPWYNSGAASFPFQPIPGSLIEHGTAAPFSAVELANTVYWLGQDETGSGTVWRADGYTPTRISEHGLENLLSEVPIGLLQQSVAWAYQDTGHLFYMLQVPGLRTTWVYDVLTDQWHQRGEFNTLTMRYDPFVGNTHCWGFGKHLVGSSKNATIYAMSHDYQQNQLVA